jgi:hypothetical protein
VVQETEAAIKDGEKDNVSESLRFAIIEGGNKKVDGRFSRLRIVSLSYPYEMEENRLTRCGSFSHALNFPGIRI